MLRSLTHPLFGLAAITFGVASSSCAVAAGPPEFVDMEFLGLANGSEASIVHIDVNGHAKMEPVEFLKGRTLLGWAANGLDQVIICEKSSIHQDEIEFKYYKKRALTKTFFVKTATYAGKPQAPYWMLLLPGNNCLLANQIGRAGVARFDLSANTERESAFPSTTGYPEIRSNPLWDPVKHNLIVAIEDRPQGQKSAQYFLARLSPDDLTLSDEAPVGLNSLIDQILYLDEAGNNVIFYGEVGGVVAHWGDAGFYSISSSGGIPKLLMAGVVSGVMPAIPIGATHFTAIINRRYVITTRGQFGEVPGERTNDAHTYLVDLQAHSVQKLDMPYVTWPISQDGLHVQGVSTPTSTTAQDQPKATGAP